MKKYSHVYVALKAIEWLYDGLKNLRRFDRVEDGDLKEKYRIWASNSITQSDIYVLIELPEPKISNKRAVFVDLRKRASYNLPKIGQPDNVA